MAVTQHDSLVDPENVETDVYDKDHAHEKTTLPTRATPPSVYPEMRSMLPKKFNQNFKTSCCTCKTVLLSAIGLSVVGSIATITIYVILKDQTTYINPTDVPLLKALDGSVCIGCDDLAPVLQNNDLWTITNTADTKVCCTKDPSFQRLLSMILIENHQDERKATSTNPEAGNSYLRSWSSRNPAAHVYLNVSALPAAMRWEEINGYEVAFANGITLVNGRLEVPTHGIYFVYSFTSYRILPRGPISSGKYFMHFVNRENSVFPNNGIQTLLVRDETSPQPAGRETDMFGSSFLCGVLKLRMKDQIWAQVSNNTLVNPGSLTNYFGLFRLTEL